MHSKRTQTQHKKSIKFQSSWTKSPEKVQRFFFLTVGIILIGLGIIFRPITESPKSGVVIIPTQAPVYTPFKIDSFLDASSSLKPSYKEAPTKLTIPEIGIDVAVSEAKIVNGYWEVFPDKAGWGEGSAASNEIGNQVIFAHAREGLFLSLRNIKLSENIYVQTTKRKITYQVIDIKEVNPNETAVIAKTKEPILTLYTCTGFADSKRLIVKAKRIG